VSVERHSIALPAGKLSLVLHVPEPPGRVPCVIACHGLSASKDSDKYLLLGDALPAAGLALARFDFRGCGESSGREEETTSRRGSRTWRRAGAPRGTPSARRPHRLLGSSLAASSRCSSPPGGRTRPW